MPKDYSKNLKSNKDINNIEVDNTTEEAQTKDVKKKTKKTPSKKLKAETNTEADNAFSALIPSMNNDLDDLSEEVNTTAISKPQKRVFGRSVNDRVVEVCNKLEDLIEKGYNDSMVQTKPFGIFATSNLIANYIKLIEVSRELELGSESGIDIYEIIAYAPQNLKEEFQGLWLKLIENYATIKGLTIDEVLKTKSE